jgi:hypothetical protein
MENVAVENEPDDIDKQIKMIKDHNINKAQIVLTLGLDDGETSKHKGLYIAGPKNYDTSDYLFKRLEEENISI